MIDKMTAGNLVELFHIINRRVYEIQIETVYIIRFRIMTHCHIVII